MFFSSSRRIFARIWINVWMLYNEIMSNFSLNYFVGDNNSYAHITFICLT